MNNTSTDLIKSLDNPATSYWLKDALNTVLRRDPVDALIDISILKEILKKKCAELNLYYCESINKD